MDDRFERGSSKRRSGFEKVVKANRQGPSFFRFGPGAHACIGMDLATVEATAFCHAMLTRRRRHPVSARNVNSTGQRS